MKAVFGVGNPGQEYKLTRHNVGFHVIDKFGTQKRITMKLDKDWLFGEKKSDGNSYLLIKPLSFVNECGRIAREVIHQFNLSLSDFLVVLDDFSLPLGSTRLRPQGSSGGHKGLESIIYHLESELFPRLRIGIGPIAGDSVDFVLSKFKKNELQVLDIAIERAISSIEVFIREGVNKAMEVCNIR